MESNPEFRRRRIWWFTGLALLFVFSIVPLMAGWDTPMFLTPLPFAAFLIWSLAGGTWVIQARTPNAGTVLAPDEARRRRRIYLVSIVPAAGFLWRRLQDYLESTPDSIGDAIVVPLLWVAGAIFMWWMWAQVMWRFVRIVRNSG